MKAFVLCLLSLLFFTQAPANAENDRAYSAWVEGPQVDYEDVKILPHCEPSIDGKLSEEAVFAITLYFRYKFGLCKSDGSCDVRSDSELPVPDNMVKRLPDGFFSIRGIYPLESLITINMRALKAATGEAKFLNITGLLSGFTRLDFELQNIAVTGFRSSMKPWTDSLLYAFSKTLTLDENQTTVRYLQFERLLLEKAAANLCQDSSN